MTAAERGVYAQLLFSQWALGGDLPKDPAKLARHAGVTRREFARCWPAVAPCFEPGSAPETLANQKLKAQLAGAELRHVKGVENADKRWKIAKNDHATAHAYSEDRGQKKEKKEKNKARAPKSGAPHQGKLMLLQEDLDSIPESQPSRMTPDTALGVLAKAARGRFVWKRLNRGQVFRVIEIIGRYPDAASWDLVGAWLAAGGDAWRGVLDQRQVGDFDSWIAQAEAWDRAKRPQLARNGASGRHAPPPQVMHPDSAQAARALFEAGDE